MDDGRKQQQAARSSTDHSAELQKYIIDPHEDEKMCPIKYWKEYQSVYPSLAEFAVVVLGIPASSAPVERLFTIAGKNFRPERSQLANVIFQKLMFIRCNKKYF